MRLTLVIPVWNDPEGLKRLLTQTAAMNVFSQIIVSDDASDPPVSAAALGLPELSGDPRLLWLRSADQRGAGHARNIALPEVTGDHVIYFDSDDLFLPEFSTLAGELDGISFDFCIFRHVDSRMQAKGALTPLAPDDGEWRVAGAMTAVPSLLSRRGAGRLCRISAYPWNKIYRTGFLREAGIRCTEIPVHNDLELHWLSFLKADRILTSQRLCCTHYVQAQGQRLTNRSGEERIHVFRALEAVHVALEGNPRAVDFIEPFAEFYTRLFPWINDLLDPELRGPFAARTRAFLLRRMTVPMFTLIALRNPAVGAKINRALSAVAR